MIQRDTRGGIVLDSPRGTHGYTELGNPQYGWRRLVLADAITTADPATHLSGAVTDGGDGAGIAVPLTGSWGSGDWTGTYWYGIWPLLDNFGRVMGGNVEIALSFAVRLRGSFSETDDFAIGMALVNETALTGATVDGKGIHINANGAGGAGVIGTGNSSSTNGTGTQTNAAAGQANVVWAVGHVAFSGQTTGRLWCTGNIGLDSSGVVVASSGAVPVGTVTMGGPPARWYLAMYAGRNDATNASAKTPAADCYYAAPLHRPLVNW